MILEVCSKTFIKTDWLLKQNIVLNGKMRWQPGKSTVHMQAEWVQNELCMNIYNVEIPGTKLVHKPCHKQGALVYMVH